MRGFALALSLILTACQQVPRAQVPRADIVADWPQLPAGVKLGQVSALDVDAQGRVYVLQRGRRGWVEPFPAEPIAEPTVYVFDGATGKLLDRWGANAFTMPHALSVDPEGKVWITDAGREQVFQYSADGKLELTLGTDGGSGDDKAHFGRPTDVAFDGDRVLVSDGYLNGRVAIFDRASGRYLGQFGMRGQGEGQFAIPHAIAKQGDRLVVADRENARAQWFERSGRFAALWPMPVGGHPYSVKPLPDGGVVTLEGRDSADRGGALLRFWSRDGKLNRTLDASAIGGPSKGHDLAVAPDGTIYVADVDAGRVVKIAPPALGR
jgi:DNA-binding beta-propeller fold protein YncE